MRLSMKRRIVHYTVLSHYPAAGYGCATGPTLIHEPPLVCQRPGQAGNAPLNCREEVPCLGRPRPSLPTTSAPTPRPQPRQSPTATPPISPHPPAARCR